MLAFDSNVFIYFLDKHPEFYTAAIKALERAAKEPASISVLVYTECLARLTGKAARESQAALDEFCGQFEIEAVPINKELAVRAAQLRAQHSLSTADALHAASALLSGATTLITNDLKLAGKQISGLKIVGLQSASLG